MAARRSKRTRTTVSTMSEAHPYLMDDIPKLSEDKESVRSHSDTEQSENEFPSLVGKTYDMVDDPRTDHIVCWADDGNGFVVKNSDDFCSKILPTYFRTKRFRSFVRNLNMYGFRSRKQAQEGVYRFKHPQFRRHKKSLLSKIRKKTTQKSILSDLRGAIKELRADYAKLARSHAKIEGVLSQITKVLPVHVLQKICQNGGLPGAKGVVKGAGSGLEEDEENTASSPLSTTSTTSTQPDIKSDTESALPTITDMSMGVPSFKMEPVVSHDALFGPFAFDGSAPANSFGWGSLLAPPV
uniref:HSF-type DNA-binding domain-containing protein n=1 Tax=Lotharella globosa TaxID=91324 RepID=A0A6U3AU80_9EUKA|eukprot:CAMPEP_0167788756 /NCGR_PEP_ID=MMETSP0111_2-20121227/10227_1 /TAXON_ID=91324 /ORGANISM="Lotharella globosa, Strain CCCM811" /LENGTH=296 /DNA_ID=CAMNT_0007680689 /DNA_START=53 /DNA_END=943 /DNA_ORIENTATION=-